MVKIVARDDPVAHLHLPDPAIVHTVIVVKQAPFATFEEAGKPVLLAPARSHDPDRSWIQLPLFVRQLLSTRNPDETLYIPQIARLPAPLVAHDGEKFFATSVARSNSSRESGAQANSFSPDTRPTKDPGPPAVLPKRTGPAAASSSALSIGAVNSSPGSETT